MKKSLLAHGFTEDLVNFAQVWSVPSQSHKQVQSEAVDIIESMQHTLLQDFQRKNIDGSLGRWFCLKKPRASYFALAHPVFPERLAYQLLNVTLPGNGHSLRGLCRRQ